MRTTLTLRKDAIAAARRLARHKRVSLGEAVSELVVRGAQAPVAVTQRQGLAVVQLPKDSEKVTAATVEQLIEELP